MTGEQPVSVIIRTMSEADRTSWAGMRQQLWDSLSVEDHLGEIAEMLAAYPKCMGYMAVVDDRPVGFAEVCIREYANGCTARPVPFLEGIWVEPAHRQRDIGRMLIGRIERDMTAQGFDELCSDADIDNKASHHAHESWGFEETERVVYFRKPFDRVEC